jgi:para-aminobenzoate synthetase
MVAEVNGELPLVFKNDEVTWEYLKTLQFDNVIISPGPGRPDRSMDFGVSADVISKASVPILGVCLGHQGISHLFGGKVIHAPEPMHGRADKVFHEGDFLFEGIPSPFSVIRYHSLVVADLPNELKIVARTADGIVMGIQHKSRPIFGVQFHPESILSEFGYRLFENFARLTKPEFQVPQGLCHGTKDLPKKERKAPVKLTEGNRRLYVRKINQSIDPALVFQEMLNGTQHPFWLDSSLVKNGLSRFSFMGNGEGPHSHLLQYDLERKRPRISSRSGTRELSQSIFDYLEEHLGQAHTSAGALPFDFNCGYVGYMGYEMKAECGASKAHKSAQPDAQFLFADRIIAFDHLEECMYLVCLDSLEEEERAHQWIQETQEKLNGLSVEETHIKQDVHAESAPPSFFFRDSKAAYIDKIKRSQAAIIDGETYELCLTNRLKSAAKPDSFALYRELRSRNPAPYAAYLDFGEMQIICSSPERFLKADRFGIIESKPIKGTEKRGQTETEDILLKEKLRNSEKNRAENLMIADLLRHDLGQVCDVGSVHIPKLMEIESYATVHQMVSTICGKLRDEVSIVHAFKELFPGGSMTGAPKIRTMEIIDELEQEARGIYSGAIGYFSLSGACDFNIVIRTIVATGDGISIGVGGAITALSDAEEEVDEIILKATAPVKAVYKVLGHDPERINMSTAEDMVKAELTRYREKIDGLDNDLLRCLIQRLDVCKKVAEFKKEWNIPMMQPARVTQVKLSRSEIGKQLGLDENFVVSLYELIIGEACRLENEVIDG